MRRALLHVPHSLEFRGSCVRSCQNIGGNEGAMRLECPQAGRPVHPCPTKETTPIAGSNLRCSRLATPLTLDSLLVAARLDVATLDGWVHVAAPVAAFGPVAVTVNVDADPVVVRLVAHVPAEKHAAVHCLVYDCIMMGWG